MEKNHPGASAQKHQKPTRQLPVDLLRGLIMVFMALDHANYFIAQQHSSGEYWGGPVPQFASGATFLTRLITHYCAPGFFFLLGVGMIFFASSRRKAGWSESQILRHFLLRGIVLIVLQLTLVNTIWQLGPFHFPRIYIGVLIALGGGMVLSSLLLRLPPVILISCSIILFVGTELLHPDPSLWNLLETDPYNLILLRSGGTATFWSNYPVLAWMELILFGMAFGKILERNSGSAYRLAGVLAAGSFIGFIVVRGLNGFGNIRPIPGQDWIAYLNLVKYPPSMTFTLFAMSGNLFLLWAFSHLKSGVQEWLRPLAVIGREPLYFYILHLLVYAGVGRWLTPSGTSLGQMYLLWLLSLALLYALTLAYTRFKQGRPQYAVWRYL